MANESRSEEAMRPCPACGSRDIRLFLHGIYDSEQTNVLECGHCGLHYLDVLMSEEEEEAYYNGYYRKQQSRAFRELQLGEQQERSRLHYEQYRDLYLGIVSGCGSLLEIGSGTGGFLKFARQSIPGIELTATERCNENAEFISANFADVSFTQEMSALQGKTYDAILALAVFEHLRDGPAFLREMRRHLNPNGKLVLKVPNKDNPLVCTYHLDEFKTFMYMKQHYWTLTERAFEILAGQTGYLVEGFHYLQVWGLDNHLSWLRYRRPRDFSDITKFLDQETLDAYNRDLIKAKTTDTFIAVLTPDR